MTPIKTPIKIKSQAMTPIMIIPIMHYDYRRTFRISSRVDAGAIAAALNRGVLSIHLPKAESEKPRHIAVTVQ